MQSQFQKCLSDKKYSFSVLLKGLEYYADDASKVGQTFVRLVSFEKIVHKTAGHFRNAILIITSNLHSKLPTLKKRFKTQKSRRSLRCDNYFIFPKSHFQKHSATVESGDKQFSNYLQAIRVRMQIYQQYFKVIHSYMVLLKSSIIQEFIKYTSRGEQPTESLQKALELMLSIPQRATDMSYIKNIQGSDQGEPQR